MTVCHMDSPFIKILLYALDHEFLELMNEFTFLQRNSSNWRCWKKIRKPSNQGRKVLQVVSNLCFANNKTTALT